MIRQNVIFACIIFFTFAVVLPVTATTEEEMRASMQGIMDALNAHNVDQMGLYWTDDIVYDFVAQPPSLNGKGEVAAFFGGLFQGIPDFQSIQTCVLVSDNIMVTEAIGTGTHLGEFAGIPATGNTMQVLPLHIWEFEGDKVKHATEYLDMASAMIQLGIMPTPDLDLSLLVPSFPVPDPEPTGMSSMEAAGNLANTWNSHDLENYAKLIHSDAAILISPLASPMNRDAFIASQELYFLAYSDLEQEIVRMIDMGDGYVLVEVIFKGTNDGMNFGIPATNNFSAVRGAWLARFDADGLMTNLNAYWDELTVLMNLGLFSTLPEMPEPPPTPDYLVQDQISSPSLDGNLLGDPATRDVLVYLPPSYNVLPDKRYPVVYILHGFSGDHRMYVGVTNKALLLLTGIDLGIDLGSIVAELLDSGEMGEVIIVLPDSSNVYGGSWYERSAVLGDYRSYIARDLVEYIDSKYRTIPDREHRGITGHSMGGYGSLSLAIEYPDVFGAVAALSPGFPNDVEVSPTVIEKFIAENPDTLGEPIMVRSDEDMWEMFLTRYDTNVMYSLAAAYSSNANNPPYYADLPVQYPDKNIVPEVWEKWKERDLVSQIERDGTNLVNTSIFIDQGVGETMIMEEVPGVANTLAALDAQGIPYAYDEFDGDHLTYQRYQLASALTFLSPVIGATPPSETEMSKVIANRIFSEIWNQGNLDAADEIFAADFARYDPGNPDLTGAVGPDGFKQLVSTYRIAFPDTHWTVDEMVAEGDLVATRWTSEGTHTGELMGMPATDLPVTVTGVSILRIADGKVVEEWVDWDSMGLMEQLGFAPATRQGYSWSDPSEVTGDPGDPEANKAVVMRYVEAWNQHNLDMVDEVMIADVIHHDPVLFPGESALEPHKQVVGMYFLAFPDLHSEVEVTLAEGDKVVMHGAVTGTHQGELMGIPATGRQVAWTWTTISRIADGKMVEMWWQYDVMGLMTQLTAQVIPDGLAVDEITSPSLTGNLLGDPDTREVIVYLPPSYATSDKRYPAVYLLHGYSGNARTFVSDAFTGLYWPADNDFPKDGLYGMLNDMIASEHLEEMIVIMPDASNTYGGSWYTNSELNGNYEDYIVNDLVSYIDNSYRTIPTRSGRAIVGHSMGGYGAMKLAMKHPDVFGAVGTLSGGISFEAMAASIPLVIAENPDGFIGPSPDKPFTSITYSMAAAFSPNLGNPPFFVDIPYEYPTGSLVYETWEKWMSHDVLTMLTPYAASLGSLRGIYVDSGDQDEFGTAPLAETAHQILDAVGIEHEYEIYSGTHFNRLFERLGIVLKFFSDTLVAEHKEGYTNVFFASLSSGLNMISLPLEPIEPYTARSFAEEIGATTVIRYDESLGKFVGFTPAAPDDGFPIEGGKGYIVNVLGEGTVAFTGAAWTNEPPSDMAPPAQVNTAWAFVISGSVLDGDGMSAADECYTAIVKNLRTGDAFTESVESSGYFAAACADLSRKAVIGVGDQVEVAVIDSSGDLVSGPFIHDITMDSIRNAVMDVHLKLGDIIPAESSLLQNYPNPFNPETWIPYHLHDAETVIIRIYNATGQLIKTLDLGHKDAGIYASRSRAGYWDGRNEAGEIVASGIYFYTIQAGEYTATRKMTATK